MTVWGAAIETEPNRKMRRTSERKPKLCNQRRNRKTMSVKCPLLLPVFFRFFCRNLAAFLAGQTVQFGHSVYSGEVAQFSHSVARGSQFMSYTEAARNLRQCKTI